MTSSTPSIFSKWLSLGAPVLFAAIVFVLLWIFANLCKRILWRALNRITHRTLNPLDNEILKSLHGPANAISLVLASLGTLLFAVREEHQLFTALSLLTKFAVIALSFWTLERIVTTIFVEQDRLPLKLEASTKVLLNTVLRIVIASIGLLVILDTAGISITPLLASLGVGSLAVALALQDTLGNFFSGVYLLADQPIRPGDFVQLEDGSQGNIVKIGWRSTQILNPSNHTIIVPNSKLASSRIMNFDLPNPASALSVTFRVGFEADLNRVEQLALAAAREVMARTPGAVKNFTPLLRFHTLAESAFVFDLTVRTEHMSDQSLLKHELLKALQVSFAAEKIAIPNAERTIIMKTKDSHAPSIT